MEIRWKSKRLKSELENNDFLESLYGKKVARNVVKRLNEIKYSDSYTDIPSNAKKHSVKKGNKFLYFAVDLPNEGGGRGKWRLTFEPYGNPDLAKQSTIKNVKILGIINYH